MEQRIYCNEDWYFTEEYSEAFRDTSMEELAGRADVKKVRLPHTVKETPLHYFDESIYQMVSGYKRTLFAPDEWKGKRILLTFEGAAHDSIVYCNGKEVGTHHCGYTAFTVELTDVLRCGEENELCVRLDSRETLNVPPFGYVIDYMTYGGIYRDVYLEVKEPVYIEDVFAEASVTDIVAVGESSKIGNGALSSHIELSALDEDTYRGKTFLVKQTLAPYQKESSGLVASVECKFTPSSEIDLSQTLPMTANQVSLWEPDQPTLYELTTSLYLEGSLLDTKVTVIGFRKAEFQKDGFYLNGRRFEICGLNRHQSFPYVGYAMPKSMQVLDAEICKKELGLNAVRTSHYPQSHDFLRRCDELGLLVFTEFPGWQHIGDDAWKEQALFNASDMIRQYRNHPSIILWGVRINESVDDDAFYQKTNELAHKLDPTRATGGVRAIKKSHLYEDVYTYNDFSHEGNNPGCEPKKNITSNLEKAYLVSEYNGHMYPTKAFDNEERRAEHAIRHANVLDGIRSQEDIAGSFGWCMFDYNTHQDFGSGDRICYHGVMDMFRNPKLAAAVYAVEQDATPVLEISSSMDIGEHPGCNRGSVWILTNADSVRMYKNDSFIKEYHPSDSPYKHLKHGPILIDDFIGDAVVRNERFEEKDARDMTYAMNLVSRGSVNNIPKKLYPLALKLALKYKINFDEVSALYTKYIGNWGGTATVYRFDAIKDGKVVKTVVKEPMHEVKLEAIADHTTLTEEHSYDVALVRIKACDEHGNVLPFYAEPITLTTSGELELIGPKVISLSGGMGGTYVRTIGKSGSGKLLIETMDGKKTEIPFTITKQSDVSM